MSRRTRLVARFTAIGLVVLAVGWAAWAHAVIQTPRVENAAPVDAVLVLGGLDGTARTQRALDMARGGLADTVILSMPVGTTDTLAVATCERPPVDLDVMCFRPDPSTTRGEARELRRLAEQHGWTRVAVVTSTYHVSRSRMIIARCYSGTLLMVPSRESTSVAMWAYQWLYQTAGYAKAEVLRGC
ncbi:YdcF family protein [Jatrophihabitans sp. YIM 134969]